MPYEFFVYICEYKSTNQSHLSPALRGSQSNSIACASNKCKQKNFISPLGVIKKVNKIAESLSKMPKLDFFSEFQDINKKDTIELSKCIVKRPRYS